MKRPSGGSEKVNKAVFLSPEPPYPLAGGGPLRSASLLEYLAERYEVDVIAFRQPGSSDPREAFPAGKIREVYSIDLPFHSRSTMHRAIRNLARAAKGSPPLLDRFSGFGRQIKALLARKRYEWGVIEHFWCAPYVEELRNFCRRVALDLHNVESAWHASVARTEAGITSLLHQRFARAYKDLEGLWLPRFDLILAPSANDAERIAGQNQRDAVAVYPNSLPTIERPLKCERDSIVFTGNLAYQPNRSAILHFRTRIWPVLRGHYPALYWEIAGKNPEAAAPLLRGDDRIRLIGPLDDPIKFISSAKAAIVPVLAGSGTRVKILEAWAAGTPVVSTGIGADGLEYCDGKNLLIADSPEDFGAALVRLLGSPAERARIGSAGRENYERLYTWERAWTALENLL